MIVERVVFACALCLLLSGMRDPFLPPPDTCKIAQLDQWLFRGTIQGKHMVGILRDANKHWHRVAVGELLSTGWRVISITVDELQISTGKDCIPAQWRWKRDGTQNEKMDSGPYALRPASRQHSDNAARHTDR
ncbi:HofP DNA utilization family protein [Kosakonia oryziphila]|uniref:Pilus assembly protein HofP n=1 Tax=Kosakonia oryziphila TaxID=1005667 RepID=A0A1C4FZC9_9ENTR|nr:HofP DNA utilization family protein [Kosakonia oryziphila]SCC61232.1 pilus assembly protein HofP [Kosakonia oryziphila]